MAEINKTKVSTSGGDNTETVIEYTVWDTFDKDVATALLLNTSSVFFDGLVRKAWTIDPGSQKDIWECTITYGDLQPLSGDLGSASGSQFNFSIGGGTQRITQSKGTISSHAATGTATDHKGAIGVSRDTVEGVDIKVPVYTFTETHAIPVSQVTAAYKQLLFDVGNSPVNNAKFRGFAAGEVLFEGVTGTQKDQDVYELTYQFSVSKNATGLTVGGLTGIDKKGWEYIWTEYEDVEDSTSNAIAKRPKFAYVERVYDDSNFADLGIGVA